MKRKGKINSYYYLEANPKSIDLEKYTKDYVELDYHYTSDLLFVDKISENAKKIGYRFEKKLKLLIITIIFWKAILMIILNIVVC